MAVRLLPGLCSVTLRALSPADVVSVAAAGQLELIEWGGDVHVPVGDLGRACEVRARTEDSGLEVCSYGSYFGRGEATDFEPVLATAIALGAPRIRVWAGSQGSAATDPAGRARVVAELRAAAEPAAAAGVEPAVEYHPNTLTDSAASTLALLDEVGRGLVTYWQPPVGEPDAEALGGLRTVLDRMVTVHVFSWWPARERLPLTAREQFWRDVCGLLATKAPRGVVPMLLEFVPDDDPAALRRDAATLRELLAAI
ncbi:MAG TPA: TIM barrel protein [Jatrophihabitantaceae bacterium]|jgi:hypothetical protein